jgi:hypothetical protein
MKPGSDSRASLSNDGRLLDSTLGSDSAHQDRPHHVGQALVSPDSRDAGL